MRLAAADAEADDGIDALAVHVAVAVREVVALLDGLPRQLPVAKALCASTQDGPSEKQDDLSRRASFLGHCKRRVPPAQAQLPTDGCVLGSVAVEYK
jgi:hypothetical protein